MLPSAYIETSVISYLTGRQSRDAIAAAHQQLTRDWWSSGALVSKSMFRNWLYRSRVEVMRLLRVLVWTRSPGIRLFE